MATPPMAVADPRRPAIAVSAIPTRGIVIPASILGMARLKICLFRLRVFIGYQVRYFPPSGSSSIRR